MLYSKSLRTPKGTTLLHEAVDGDQPDVVQLLLLHGFNPDMQAKGGLTPLHLAVSKCSVGNVHVLIENGADISIQDDQGQDTITKAELRSKKCEAILKLLRSKGKIIVSEQVLHCNYTISLSRNRYTSGKGSFKGVREAIEAES